MNGNFFDDANEGLHEDLNEGHLDGLRRLGLPVVDKRRSLDGRAGIAHVMPANHVSFEGPALASSTMAKYRTGWIDWSAWCDLHGIGHYDADHADVHRWLEQLRKHNLAVATVHGRLAAVSWWYERAGLLSPAKHPTIRQAMADYARTRGTGSRQARPLMLNDLRSIVAAIPTILNLRHSHPRVVRDRCLLTLGWATARRSAELVSLDVEDLAFHGDPDSGQGGGVVVHINRSKTDQASAGFVAAVPYSRHYNSCPVRTAMHQARRQGSGPLFVGVNRHGQPQSKRLHRNSVTNIVQEYVERVLSDDPTQYSSRSLRAGLVTEAATQGVPGQLIKRATGPSSTVTLTRYNHLDELFTHNAMSGDWW